MNHGFDTDHRERMSLERCGYEIVRPAKFDDALPVFPTARVTKNWAPTNNWIAASIARPGGGTQAIFLDLDYPGAFGSSARSQMWCGLTAGATVRFWAYPNSESIGTNWGCCVMWPRSPSSSNVAQVFQVGANLATLIGPVLAIT